MIEEPLDPFSEVVDERRRWTPDWYDWLKGLVSELKRQIAALTAQIAALAAQIAAPTSGATRVLLATITTTPGNNFSIGPSILTPAYDLYEIVIRAFNNTGSPTTLAARVSVDNGASYFAGAGDYALAAVYCGQVASPGPFPFVGPFSSMFLAVGQDPHPNVPTTSEIKLFHPTTNGMTHDFQFDSASYSSGYYTSRGNTALFASVAPITNIVIFWNNSGAFGPNSYCKVYGLK